MSLIKIPDNTDLAKLTQEVYRRSRPQGLGRMHHQSGDLPEDKLTEIIAHFKDDDRMALSLDYVLGRSCKFNVWKRNPKYTEDGDKIDPVEEGLFIQDSWFDHSREEYEDLFDAMGWSELKKPDLGEIMNKQRRKAIEQIEDRLSDIKSELEILKGELDDLQEEEQEYYDNMPENMQQGDKGQAAEQSASALGDAASTFEDVLSNLDDVISNLSTARE